VKQANTSSVQRRVCLTELQGLAYAVQMVMQQPVRTAAVRSLHCKWLTSAETCCHAGWISSYHVLLVMSNV
jgi:hypothetical protein